MVPRLGDGRASYFRREKLEFPEHWQYFVITCWEYSQYVEALYYCGYCMYSQVILRVHPVLGVLYCSHSQYSQYLGLQYCSYSQCSQYLGLQYSNTQYSGYEMYSVLPEYVCSAVWSILGVSVECCEDSTPFHRP